MNFPAAFPPNSRKEELRKVSAHTKQNKRAISVMILSVTIAARRQADDSLGRESVPNTWTGPSGLAMGPIAKEGEMSSGCVQIPD